MCVWILTLLLVLAAPGVRAADICPTARSQQSATDSATRIAAIACSEHVL